MFNSSGVRPPAPSTPFPWTFPTLLPHLWPMDLEKLFVGTTHVFTITYRLYPLQMYHHLSVRVLKASCVRAISFYSPFPSSRLRPLVPPSSRLTRVSVLTLLSSSSSVASCLPHLLFHVDTLAHPSSVARLASPLLLTLLYLCAACTYPRIDDTFHTFARAILSTPDKGLYPSKCMGMYGHNASG